MTKKYLFFFVLLIFFCGSLWAAGGREQNESRTAEDPSGITDSMDTSDKTPGRYNFYLEATDRAGNVTRYGPENINIDPETDLPRVTIVNPLPYMRVQGNMHIVGLAVDDDGIEKVELAIHRGIDGRGEEVARFTAEGKEYWSYFLDTTDTEIWTDGDYTITAWATDINGLSGISERFQPRQHKIATVHWRLDRRKPVTLITSHEVGALVSGNVRLRGTVTDGNGIDSLSYSIDGGNRYINTRANLDRRTGEYHWDININTRQFEDGPAVIWFQARDGNGSIGTAAHLLFVNNTGPDVRIVYPENNTTVSGVFSIAGFAQHPVGLKSVTWKAGNVASGEFELLPGNHWWSTDVDIRGQRLSNIEIEIRAEDISGNVTVRRQRYRVDQNAALPTVTLIEPGPGSIPSGTPLVVRGNAKDNIAVESIFYSINGGMAVEIPCNGYFQFQIPNIPDGTNNLEVWAKNVNGVVGPKVLVRGISVLGTVPAPNITSFTTTVGRTTNVNTFFTGITIKPEPRMTMQISLRASAAPSAASVTIGNNAPVSVRMTGSGNIFSASVPFPETLPDGLTKIVLRATDRQGNESVQEEFIFINNANPIIEQDVVQDADGTVRTVDRQVFPPAQFVFEWIRHTVLPDRRILLSSADDVLMGITSVPIRSIDVNGAGANNVHVVIDQHGRVILRATGTGEIGPLVLSMRTSEGLHSSREFTLYSDITTPTITMNNLTAYEWVQAAVPVQFTVSASNRITDVEYSIDMGVTWTSFGPVASEYNQNIDISRIDDGSIYIMIKATNESGKSAIHNFTVLKDTKPPQATIVMPITDARVNGTIRMAFAIEENGELNTIVYRRPAFDDNPEIIKEVYNSENWDNNYIPRFFEVLMDSMEMPLDNNMYFVFTDKAGNTATLNEWSFIIDQESDIPIVHIILPLENEVITTDFIASGIMFDDDGIKQIHWRVDENPWQIIEAEYGFSIPISIADLSDNEHTISVFAEDIYGVTSEPVTRTIRISKSEPEIVLSLPLFDTILRDSVEFKGTAFDRNGIKEVLISIDNGNTFNRVNGVFGSDEERVEWTYQFNTRILNDGPHVIFVRAVDRYDISSTYVNMINVDNTAPVVTLESPADGSISTGFISIMGRAQDLNLNNITIELRSLDGREISPALRTRTLDASSIIRENLDLAGQEDGHYNIAVSVTDRAGNVTRVSRNFELARQTYKNFIEILYPLENESVNGEFNLYGYAGGSDKAGIVTIRINGRDFNTSEVDDSGYFRFNLNSESLNTGDNVVTIHSSFGGNTQVASRAYNINYKADGPWVTIDSFTFGEFAYNRPYVFGRAGYTISDEDRELLGDRNTDRETRAFIQGKTLAYTEISFDNGKTFTRTSGRQNRNVDYRYRLETGDMPEGMHYMIVRSTFRNGETAITRMLVQVDKTAPVIRLISPEMGGRYNKEIVFSASATDDIELTGLTYHLRFGDKAMYEIPGFLQGLYFESTIPPFIGHFGAGIPWVFKGGATYMDFGFGLSFFDDNVKVQLQYGFMTQDLHESLGGEKKPIRFGGQVLGVKLLANVYSLPFISLLGPDFEWLSATFSIGATFSIFNVFNQENPNYSTPDSPRYYTQSGKPTWLSALLLQIEFPRVTLQDRRYLRTFSVFTEGQLWFTPTDVDAVAGDIPIVLPKIIIGLRLYIF
ncbi:MAG: Ig-like domain-containing protein [Treponema sp.]|nr:Ig-like domain-containing protein [Treponema sp.]